MALVLYGVYLLLATSTIGLRILVVSAHLVKVCLLLPLDVSIVCLLVAHFKLIITHLHLQCLKNKLVSTRLSRSV